MAGNEGGRSISFLRIHALPSSSHHHRVQGSQKFTRESVMRQLFTALVRCLERKEEEEENRILHFIRLARSISRKNND